MAAMRVKVHVKPRAKMTQVERITEREFKVCVTAPPSENQANEAVQEALSDFLGIAKSRVVLVGGARSREKIFDIL